VDRPADSYFSEERNNNFGSIAAKCVVCCYIAKQNRLGTGFPGGFVVEMGRIEHAYHPREAIDLLFSSPSLSNNSQALGASAGSVNYCWKIKAPETDKDFR
jgi:hypothetical protein